VHGGRAQRPFFTPFTPSFASEVAARRGVESCGRRISAFGAAARGNCNFGSPRDNEKPLTDAGFETRGFRIPRILR